MTTDATIIKLDFSEFKYMCRKKRNATAFKFHNLVFFIANTLLKDSCDVDAQCSFLYLKKTTCSISL